MLDFTSPILTSGAAITRYVDKEDGAEYIYSLFVPSDASTAFPVFDQPDLKARFTLDVLMPAEWKAISNEKWNGIVTMRQCEVLPPTKSFSVILNSQTKPNTVNSTGIKTSSTNPFDACNINEFGFAETKPISTYVFAFAAGPFAEVADDGSVPRAVATGAVERGTQTNTDSNKKSAPVATAQGTDKMAADVKTRIYVRKSQAAKFKPHAAEVFRLNREGIRYLETYFDYKFPFPKYDLVLIPEFPFGGMEHAGATFLREDRVIFPTEPTKNDHITRANLIFHEAAHQWFGDTVTMRWFDDLWLKEGFAEFMAYKTLEKVMPEYNAWKIFYERNKQAAYLTDSTKGTTPIYQEISNLNAAKSAYGNIVYRKAPSFLKQAEFYIGPDKFQTAVRAFLKKHEFKNAEWTDLVKEFEVASGSDLKDWATDWVTKRGMFTFSKDVKTPGKYEIKLFKIPIDPIIELQAKHILADDNVKPRSKFKVLVVSEKGERNIYDVPMKGDSVLIKVKKYDLIFPNYQDYGYGIFLLDDKSRDYVLKNIHNEKDDFLRTMMWGSLWDSVREAELAPEVYVELVVENLSKSNAFTREAALNSTNNGAAENGRTPGAFTRKRVTLTDTLTETDESTIQTLLGRVSTAMTYYLSDTQRNELAPKVEAVLIERMQNAPTPGQRITFYRAFMNIASTVNAKQKLKEILDFKFKISDTKLKTKDKFDIVAKLLILGDKDAPKLLAELEKTETSDEAKRYAYAAKSGIASAENKAKFWNDFTANKDISESWIEAAFGPFNSPRHAELTLPYLEKAFAELPNLKRSRKIFFVNGWLAAFIGGQRSEQALSIVNKFLTDNPNLDKDLRLKILENVDLIERAVKIRSKFANK